MGIYDRDYQRQSPAGSGAGRVRRAWRSPGAWSVTTWLIIINSVIYLLTATVLSTQLSPSMAGRWSVLHEWGHFSTVKFFRLEVWRLVTFQFLHDPDSFLHILFNMFGLWVFGPIVEETLGRRKYLAFYLVCGICGGLMYLVLNLIGVIGISLPGALDVDPQTPLVGASAGVFGVIMACAFVAPDARVQLLIPPIPLKMKWFAYGYVAFTLFNLLLGGHNAGGDAAHIGGAIAGFFFIRRPNYLLDFFDVFGDSRPGGRKKRQSRALRTPRAGADKDIDRILDKVSREGIQSLNAREKKQLEKASRNSQRRP